MDEILVREACNLPRAARVGAMVNAAGADALFVSWKNKYTYWTARPQTVIRQFPVGTPLDPNFVSFRANPRDPAYTSGLSTVSGAVSEVLAFFFPKDAERVRGLAQDAMNSRLYDGSHWPHDNAAGYAAGVSLSREFIRRARTDGARPRR